MKITNELIEEINRLISFGLTKGRGIPEEGKMCIEALVTVALKEHFSDQPSCVGSEVNKCKINLNDCDWPSNQDRAKGMKYLAVAQLGSIDLDQEEYKRKLKDRSNKILLPFLIRHDPRKENHKWAEVFENLSSHKFEQKWKEFHSNNYNYYDNDYDNYNNYNNYNDYDYNYNNYNNYYYKLEWLTLIASVILEVLKEMKSPGCEFLHLVK